MKAILRKILSPNLGFAFSIFLFACCITAHAQLAVVGQIYSAKISETCKLKTDGGCSIAEFDVLAFEQDSVTNYKEIYGFCLPADTRYNKSLINPKKYGWHEINGKIYIEGFGQFEFFEYDIYKLTGTFRVNGEAQLTEFFREIYEE